MYYTKNRLFLPISLKRQRIRNDFFYAKKHDPYCQKTKQIVIKKYRNRDSFFVNQNQAYFMLVHHSGEGPFL